ncbi:MAG: inositol 2-dehydrogenase [Anaerolineae bacterium]|nr:inositol 2-dehydrogenase [Anaerolineae bacterium]
MTLNIGVIGAGRIGKVHAENLATRVPGTAVGAIADVVLGSAQEVAARLHIPKVTADYREILRDPAIQAVAICSATDTHSQIIIEAAQAGKHIFCEKPIDFNLDRIDQALAAVEKAGVKLQIGFNRRFDANYARVRQAIASHEIGELHILHIISRDPGPPPVSYIKVSGGIFLDMSIHDFDMARFLTGSDAVEVYTVAGVKVDPAIGEAGDVDTAFVVMQFANGATVTIDNSRKAVYGYDQRVEAFGSAGAIATDNLYPNAAIISTAESIRRDLPLNFFMDRYTQSYEAEIRAFVEAVTQNKPIPVSGQDGRVPVVMGLAARKSHLEKRPVKLSEIG